MNKAFFRVVYKPQYTLTWEMSMKARAVNEAGCWMSFGATSETRKDSAALVLLRSETRLQTETRDFLWFPGVLRVTESHMGEN